MAAGDLPVTLSMPAPPVRGDSPQLAALLGHGGVGGPCAGSHTWLSAAAGWMVGPESCVHLEPQNVTLLKMVFVNVIS